MRNVIYVVGKERIASYEKAIEKEKATGLEKKVIYEDTKSIKPLNK